MQIKALSNGFYYEMHFGSSFHS